MSSSYSSQRINKNLYQLGLISLVVVIIWVGYEVYYTLMTPLEVNTNKVDLTPLSSELYIEDAQQLMAREVVPPVDLEKLSTPLQASPSALIDPEATESSDLF